MARLNLERMAIMMVAAMLLGGLGVCAVWLPGNLNLLEDRGRCNRTMMEMKQLASRLALRKQEQGSYPDRIPEQRQDGWSGAIRYSSNGTHYWLGSAGADREWEHETLAAYGPDAHNRYGSDVVLRDGTVIHGRYRGMQISAFDVMQ